MSRTVRTLSNADRSNLLMRFLRPNVITWVLPNRVSSMYDINKSSSELKLLFSMSKNEEYWMICVYEQSSHEVTLEKAVVAVAIAIAISGSS